MSRFTIIPTDKRLLPTDFISGDAGTALALIDRLKYDEVDVLRDGLYLFSAEQGKCGFWSIFGRKQLA